MLREIPHVVALALVLGAAPAFAQPAPAPASAAAAPEDSTAARTLEQNRRVFSWSPAPSEIRRGMAARPVAPVARDDWAGPAPAGGAGRKS